MEKTIKTALLTNKYYLRILQKWQPERALIGKTVKIRCGTAAVTLSLSIYSKREPFGHLSHCL